MILKKWSKNEQGYLLLESIVTLSVIATILLVLYPLIVDWVVFLDTERERVEQTRVLYEESIQWANTESSSTHKVYTIQTNRNSLKVVKNNQTIGVDIYEAEFK